MHTQTIYLGDQRLTQAIPRISEKKTTIDGIPHYSIDGYDHMNPFFMSIISNSDHWMYLSSRGGLTAGRKSPDHALFPYYTDDKIHDAIETTGPLTILLVNRGNGVRLWEPFADLYRGRIYEIRRRLHKSVYGNRILFDEVNNSLGLTFSYRWEFSERFGIVRTACVTNNVPTTLEIEILDGLRNLLPAGANRITQERLSTLLDGYKQSELDSGTGAGIFTLSSIISDRAEPSEALRATTVWQAGLQDPKILLSTEQIPAFLDGGRIHTETDLRGRRGAYILNASLRLKENESRQWMIVADVEQDTGDVLDTLSVLRSESGTSVQSMVSRDICRGTIGLRRLLAAADGLQSTADSRITGRHGANVLFNIMRGGIFADGYQIRRDDFQDFVFSWNRPLAKRYDSLFRQLPPKINRRDLIDIVESPDICGDVDMIRLIYEYLPLTFSRRHGDPSRPWNHFSIDLRKPDGTRAITYQGNWRDIFQNWEALALSYPAFLDGMITKFLNASTADGYNPYRISRDGTDWEVFDPSDPWSNIGYWGDHQIVYLNRLLELSHRYFPGLFVTWLASRRYVFADVPYRIKPFNNILDDPRNTIILDEVRQRNIDARVSGKGADGKLLHLGDKPYYVTLTEKLLITILTKISNFVPGGGIWMNTQRPEWNDANNALVGWGLSMVTVCNLRRFLKFLLSFFPENETSASVILTNETAVFFNEIMSILERFNALNTSSDDSRRKDFIKACGTAGEQYREGVYSGTFGSKTASVQLGHIRAFLSLSIDHLDQSIRGNRRNDGLYHSYNIMVPYEGGISVHRLDEMLEGQVAVLSSGILTAGETDKVLESLRRSRLYRPDQKSYILYPDKDLPRFLEKNRVPMGAVRQFPFLLREAERTDGRIMKRDRSGSFHFNGSFRNVRTLEEALDNITSGDGPPITPEEREGVLGLYEQVFSHKTFTGRSGTFFKYEGLGSVYWHMVSKLLVAVQENFLHAAADKASPLLLDALASHYHHIREGIGIHKSAEEYGAFPVDPYSHTPGFAGVQQPGMTGQVKEDIITRFGELGVKVDGGKIHFEPQLLQQSEFFSEPTTFTYGDLSGAWKTIPVPDHSIAFTCCSVPVVYRITDKQQVRISMSDDSVRSIAGTELDEELSTELFLRTGRILRIDIDIIPDF